MSEYALRPSVAGLLPRTTEHDGADAGRVHPENVLSRALKGMPRTNDVESGERTQALMACLSGDTLDLRALPREMCELPYELPEKAWAALQAMAAREHPPGIRTLRLPMPAHEAEAFASLARQLGAFDALDRLVVSVSAPGGTINLAGLPALPHLLRLELELHGQAPAVVALPATGEFEVTVRSPGGAQLVRAASRAEKGKPTRIRRRT